MQDRLTRGQVVAGMNVVILALQSKYVSPAKCAYNAGTRIFSTEFGCIAEPLVLAAANGDARGLYRWVNNAVMHTRRN